MPAGVNLFLHLLDTVQNARPMRMLRLNAGSPLHLMEHQVSPSPATEDNQSICRPTKGYHKDHTVFVSIGQTDLQRVRQTLIGSYRSGVDTASLIFHRAQ